MAGTGKRFAIARGILFAALLSEILAWVFPSAVQPDPFSGEMHEVYTYQTLTEVGRELLALSTFDRGAWIMIGLVMLVAFYTLLIASAPWLAGIYARSRPLRLLAFLAGVGFLLMMGYSLFVMRMEHSYPSDEPAAGFWLDALSCVLLVIGLGWIPAVRPQQDATPAAESWPG